MRHKQRMADLFEVNAKLKEIFTQHIKKIDDKYDCGVEDVSCFCGEPYPADECANCYVEDAMETGKSCLFYEELAEAEK